MIKLFGNQTVMTTDIMENMYPEYSLLYIRKGYKDGIPQGILVAMADDDGIGKLAKLQREHLDKGIETMITIPLIGGAESLCETEFEIR